MCQYRLQRLLRIAKIRAQGDQATSHAIILGATGQLGNDADGRDKSGGDIQTTACAVSGRSLRSRPPIHHVQKRAAINRGERLPAIEAIKQTETAASPFMVK